MINNIDVFDPDDANVETGSVASQCSDYLFATFDIDSVVKEHVEQKGLTQQTQMSIMDIDYNQSSSTRKRSYYDVVESDIHNHEEEENNLIPPNKRRQVLVDDSINGKKEKSISSHDSDQDIFTRDAINIPLPKPTLIHSQTKTNADLNNDLIVPESIEQSIIYNGNSHNNDYESTAHHQQPSTEKVSDLDIPETYENKVLESTLEFVSPRNTFEIMDLTGDLKNVDEEKQVQILDDEDDHKNGHENVHGNKYENGHENSVIVEMEKECLHINHQEHIEGNGTNGAPEPDLDLTLMPSLQISYSPPPTTQISYEVMDLIRKHFRFVVHHYSLFLPLRSAFPAEANPAHLIEASRHGEMFVLLTNMITREDKLKIGGSLTDYSAFGEAILYNVFRRQKILSDIAKSNFEAFVGVTKVVLNLMKQTLIFSTRIQMSLNEEALRQKLAEIHPKFPVYCDDDILCVSDQQKHISNATKLHEFWKNVKVQCLPQQLKTEFLIHNITQNTCHIKSVDPAKSSQERANFFRFCVHRNVNEVNEEYCEAYLNMLCDLCSGVGYERNHTIFINNPYYIVPSQQRASSDNPSTQVPPSTGVARSLFLSTIKHCKYLEWHICTLCRQKIQWALELWRFYNAMLQWKSWHVLFPSHKVENKSALIQPAGISTTSELEYTVNISNINKEYEQERPMIGTLLALCLKDFEIRIREFLAKHQHITLSYIPLSSEPET